MKFFDTRNYWHTKGWPCKIFMHFATQKVRRKIVTHAAFLIHKIFLYQKLRERQKCSYSKFFVLWDNKFPIKNRDISVLVITFFDTRNYSHSKTFPDGVFQHNETKILDGKSWYSIPPLHPIHERFDNRNIVKHKKVALQTFPVLWHNKVSLEYPKIPLIGIKLIVIRYFVEHNMVPLRKDSVLWEKKNWRKDVIASPSLIPNFFRYQKTSETKKDFSTEVFGTVRQKFLTENRDKTILSKKNSLPETSDLLKISSTIFAATVRGKLLTENCDTTSLSPAPPPPPQSYPKSFSTPEILWNTEEFPYDVLRYCDKTNFLSKIVLFHS